MKKTRMMLGLCVAMGLSTASFAGTKVSSPVVVNTVARTFSGSLGSARNSADTQQLLICYTLTSGTTAVCQARDASGVSVSCTTTNAALLAQVRSLNSDSYLQATYDVSGNCTDIVVGTGSSFEPKVP
ncbi:hypothetical protein G4177_05900 [Corallococcus sp. ZKHCc1 1396]|uniref:Uncharacterized protein n=1 Tax=Corallococcus soli TaxID=2710757 RepID=A0ABR9PIG2_9BACT|nr:hypothetical protein [Corallococcus soli]MBE4747713.1 hypothetical protein [Corallococcus soli]